MSFVETLRRWNEAVNCVDRQELSEALRIFLSIQEPNSKIYFDIGCLHLLNQDLDAAEKAFDCSIRKDEHLAVAFFQRGITFYKKKRYEESLGDFQRAFKALRGNQLIDYKALGLRYKLYACETLHNMALAEAQLGNWEKAQDNLVKALDLKTEAKLSLIDRALQSILKQKLFKLVEFPSKELFKPNKHYVAELEKKDYLGKAKVVASVVPQDDFSGFAPLQPQVEDGPVQKKEPEVFRTLQGEPHTVLFEFVPETSDELAVVPGNIVFVLQKDADNWASVVFNERRGLVPYNYLERLELSLASKQNEVSSPSPRMPLSLLVFQLSLLITVRDQGERVSPSRPPPTRPERKQGKPFLYLTQYGANEKPSVGINPNLSGGANISLGFTPSESRAAPTQQKDAQSTDNLCIVKVHFTFNFAVSVLCGSPSVILIDKISKKLKVPSASITLSKSPDAKRQNEISANTDMDNVWHNVNNRRLTVWCKVKEKTEAKLQNEIHLVALHSYKSSNPEDLSFDEGDTIMMLSRVNQDWLEGQSKGNTGIFPASFVKEFPVNGQ